MLRLDLPNSGPEVPLLTLGDTEHVLVAQSKWLQKGRLLQPFDLKPLFLLVPRALGTTHEYGRWRGSGLVGESCSSGGLSA